MLSESQRESLGRYLHLQSPKQLSLEQTEKIAAETNMPLRAIEYFALENGIVPCRYQRHIGCIGIDGQKKLLDSSVIIVGLGGLGGYVAEELARAGLGRITGVDSDVFDQTNLNRQLLADQENLGQKKVDQARDRLAKVNKAVEFIGYPVTLDKLPDETYRNADLVIDCLDSIDDRFVLAQKCSAADVPLVHGAIAGWYGQVAVVWPGTGMLNKLYRPGGKGIEQGLGNPPFTAALAASLMVAQAVKLLIGLAGDISEKKQNLLFFDLLDNHWQTISF